VNRAQDPPPRYGTRKNPKTGKIETYELPAPVDLEKSRKGLRDVLHGGDWFDEPLAKPKTEQPAADFHDNTMTHEERLTNVGMHETYPGSGVWVF
jgi:hypothetical protein